MAKLFGFSIEDTEPLSPNVVSPVAPNNEDGSDYYMSSGFFGQYVDIEGIYKTEFELIKGMAGVGNLINFPLQQNNYENPEIGSIYSGSMTL